MLGVDYVLMQEVAGEGALVEEVVLIIGVCPTIRASRFNVVSSMVGPGVGPEPCSGYAKEQPMALVVSALLKSVEPSCEEQQVCP